MINIFTCTFSLCLFNLKIYWYVLYMSAQSFKIDVYSLFMSF